jgi:hypothetical protein
MSIRKIVKISLVLVLVTGLSIMAYIYYIFNRTNDLKASIPDDVNALIYINTRVLIKDALTQKRESFFKTKVYEKYPFLKEMDFKNSGIDISGDLAVFEKDSIYFAIGKLSDEKQFETFIQPIIRQKYLGAATQINDLNRCSSQNKKLNLFWNENLFVFTFSNNVQIEHQTVAGIFNPKKPSKSSTPSNFELAKKDDAKIWFYLKMNPYLINQNKALKGYLQFDKTLTIHASDIEFRGNEAIDYQLKDAVIGNYFFVDSGLNIVNREFQTFCLLNMDQDAEQLEQNNLFKKRKQLTLAGTEIKEKEIITYEFDDNFDKVKVVSKIQDTINAYRLDWIENGITKTLSNSENINTAAIADIPNEIKTYLKIDQNLFEDFLPFALKFNLLAIEKQMNSHSVYQVQIEFITN